MRKEQLPGHHPALFYLTILLTIRTAFHALRPTTGPRLRTGVYGLRPFGPWRFAGPERVVTLELRQRLPLLVWLVAFVWYLAAPSAVAAVTAFVLTAWLAIAWLWARTLARGVSAERRLHYAAVQVGDTLEEHLTLTNPTRLPVLWAEFMDRSDLPGYSVSSVHAADPWNQASWRAHAVCDRRGLFQLGPWELRMGDPLGLFLVRQVYLDRQELLVYPPLAPLPPQLRPHSSTMAGDHRRLRRAAQAETLRHEPQNLTTGVGCRGSGVRERYPDTWHRRPAT